MKRVLVVWVAIVLSACTNKIEVAKEALQSGIGMRAEIEYQKVASYPGTVVCGKLSVISRSGVSSPFKPFIYRQGEADTGPAEEDWHVFCSNEPATIFYERTGIRKSERTQKFLLAIRRDYNELQTALEEYYEDNFMYPSTREGIEALIHPVAGIRMRQTFREGGYIKETPYDPWGRPYIYSGQALGGVRGTVTLLTLGADGIEGGRDENADVGTWHIKYIDHIEQP